MKIAVLIANGSEEIEALTPVDVLRRANVDVDLISVSGPFALGSHGISIKADKVVQDVDFDDYNAIVVPGGMPGATNIASDKKVLEGLKRALDGDRLVASICASPAVVLAQNGLLGQNKATCYPAPQFVSALGCAYTGKDVEISNNIITANGPKSAFKFSLAICDYLGLNPKF